VVLDLLDTLRRDNRDRIGDLLADLLKFCNDLPQVDIFASFLDGDVIAEHGTESVEDYRQVRHLLRLIAGLLFYDRQL
jgi:predicted DNA repair protein MutK